MAKNKKIYDLINYETVYNGANHKLLIEYVGAKEVKKTVTYLQPYPNSTKYVDFFAYLEKYSDSFNSTFSTKNVYGRVDPMVNYENTTRTISLAFKIPAVDLFQARMNLQKLSKLATFMYPSYQKQVDGNSYHIKQAPILRMKFGNIIMDQQTNGGVYGFINGGITYDWDLDAGVFLASDNKAEKTEYEEQYGEDSWYDYMNETREGRNRYYPKVLNLSINFSVLHNHLVGHASNETDSTYNDSEKKFKDFYGFLQHPPMHRGVVQGNRGAVGKSGIVQGNIQEALPESTFGEADRSMTADETYREDERTENINNTNFVLREPFTENDYLQARSRVGLDQLFSIPQVFRGVSESKGNDQLKNAKKEKNRK